MNRHSISKLALNFALASTVILTGPLGCMMDDQVDSPEPIALGTGSYAQVGNFGANPGNYEMFLYTPTDVSANAPAVFAFHGCLQQAAAFRNAGWEALADEYGFYVVYPQQPASNNPVNCFNWAGEFGDTTNLIRGRGENQSVASMVSTLTTTLDVDPQRVFVSGFSAGGAMVAVMMATWPDLFAAGSINAGIPFLCANTVNGAFSCLGQGRDRTPSAWGDDVRATFPSFAGPYPRLSIWHGSSDATVNPLNQRELAEQWTNVHGLSQQPSAQDTLDGLPRSQWLVDGVSVVESVVVSGMNHATAIDSANGCGSPGQYFSNVGVCSTRRQAEFFNLDGPAATPPSVSISSPADGATVSGIVSVRGDTSDDVAVASLALSVDGVERLVETDPPAGFELAWNASAEQNGVRVVDVTATNAVGLTSTASVSVLVEGGIPDTQAPTVTADPPGGQFTGSQLVTLTSNEPARIFYSTDGSAPCLDCLEYTSPISISSTTTLRFFAIDDAGNASSIASENYSIATFDESADGTCTEHYVAQRLNVSGYLECGDVHGFIDSITLFRFGSCWTEDPQGSGCP